MKMSQMNIYYPKFRKMYGHIVLLIIFGLLTAGDEDAVEKISPIDDLPVDEILYFNGLDEAILLEYFTNERDVIFRKLKTIYRINKQSSSSNPRKTGGKNRKNKPKELLVLAYGTVLAFWTAIDFKICSLLFSIYENINIEADKTLKEKCSSYFNEMYFAFHEFRRRLLDTRFLTERGKEIGESPTQGNNETETIHWVLTMSLDFILDTDTLDNKPTDDQYPGFINWNVVTVVNKNGKNYKTLFPSVDFVRKRYQPENIAIGEMYHVLLLQLLMRTHTAVGWHVFYIFNTLLLQDPLKSRTYIWDIFYQVPFSINLQMWRMIMDEFTVDPQAGKVHRISKAIEIMKKFRLMHYTVLYKTLKKYEEG